MDTESEPVMSAVRVERDGTVAVVTLDRPQQRNALSTQLLTALVDALQALDRDPDVRVAVLTGGPKVFASGADVRELLATTPAEYGRLPRAAAWRALNDLGLPLVAAVAGPALGGGCELALLCDVVIAADTAVLGQPEVGLGLIPGAGGTQRWARAAGRYRAAEIVLARRTVDAFEARDLGVVARVVPTERLVPAARATASAIAAGAPLALRAARAAVRRSEELPLAAALEHERGLLALLLGTDDSAEGITALLERRTPTFAGR
jgi:enoyl-CoA hydratase/carnithine racemase